MRKRAASGLVISTRSFLKDFMTQMDWSIYASTFPSNTSSTSSCPLLAEHTEKMIHLGEVGSTTELDLIAHRAHKAHTKHPAFIVQMLQLPIYHMLCK